jgi:hypothetical protein
MNRRKFVLSASAAISATAGSLRCLGRTAHETPLLQAASSPSIRPCRFIYDHRYPAARTFGSAAARLASTSTAVAIDGDITALWLHDLRDRWALGGAVIAGMITPRSLFCLEQLARDHWLRVVVRVEHSITGGRDASHRLTACEAAIARVTPALAAVDWPARMPAALTAVETTVGTRRVARVIGSALRADTSSVQLVSFVIA